MEAEDPTLDQMSTKRVIVGQTPWAEVKNITYVLPGAGDRFSRKSFGWWLAQVIRYTMRPNSFTLNDILIPFTRMVFQSDRIPENLASIFIRRGDKAVGQEDRLYPTESYFNTLQKFQEENRVNISSVYVSSDSQDAIDDAIAQYGTRYRFYSLPFAARSRDGWKDTEEFRADAFFMSKLVRQREICPALSSLLYHCVSLLCSHPFANTHLTFSFPQGIITTADVFISANAAVFIGTSASNQCRLINELRLTSGNFCVKYVHD